MREVDIPGGTALLKERNDLTGDDEDLIQAAYTAAGSAIAKQVGHKPVVRDGDESDESFGERLRVDFDEMGLDFEDIRSLQNLSKVAAFATLHAWSLKDPLPKTLAAFGKIARPVYRALIAEAGSEAIALAFPENLSPQGTEEATDKEMETPTGGSSSSTAPSEVIAQSPSLPESPADISPINGESSSPVPS